MDSINFKNLSDIVARIHNPIPVAEFNNHVNHLRENNNKEFKLDFEVRLSDL